MKYCRLIFLTGFIYFFFSFTSSFGQDYRYKEYSMETSNFIPLSIQTISDGNFLVMCHEYCFYPNGTAIEGCPIKNQMIKIDNEINEIYRKDLLIKRSSFVHEMVELDNGDFFAFSVAPENYRCGDIFYGGIFGDYRFERYSINKNGENLLHHIYNDECDLLPLSYISLDNKKHLVIAQTRNIDYQYVNKLITLDSNFMIIDSITYDSLELPRLKITKVDTDSLYAVFTEYLSGDLKIIAYDLNSPGYNLRSIASVGPMRKYKALSNILKDDEGLCYVTVSTYDYDLDVYDVKLVKFNFNGELIWKQSLPNDISDHGLTLKNKNNHIAILSCFDNQANNTFDTRIQLLDRDGLEIDRYEYALDTVNTFPVDFEFYDNTVMIVGIASNEKDTYPSKPKRTFIMTHLDAFSNTSTVVQHEVKIYPNPTSDEIYFESNDCNDVLHVDVYDALGKKQVSEFLTKQSLNISNLNEGMYFVKLRCGKDALGMYKIIKN